MLPACGLGPSKGDLCVVMGESLPINASADDTEETIDQVIEVNAIYWELCG
jgi:hypothetical protein